MRIGELIRIAAIAAPAAALIGAAAAVIGVDVPHAVAIGALVLAAALVLFAQRSIVPAAELEPPEVDQPIGGRLDVQRLAWSLVEHRTHIRGIVVDRVRGIAANRLAQHGLDPRRPGDADAIAALLGADAWAVLRPDRDREVSPRALDAALRAVERLPPPEPLRSLRAIPKDRTLRAD